MRQEFGGKVPTPGEPCYVHDNATLIGDVRMADYVSIWPGAVVRGDENYIQIGSYTNVQDGCLLHVSRERPLIVGDGVTVGHGAILHACTVGDGAVIGMGAIVLDGAVIGENAVVAAGAVVSPGKVVQAGTVVMGIPAAAARPVRPDEIQQYTLATRDYWRLAEELSLANMIEG